jgi:type I restriction enzyme S subunit
MNTIQKERLTFLADIQNSNIDKKSKESEKSVRLANYVDVYYNDTLTDDIDYMVSTASDSDIQKCALSGGEVIITKDSESADDIGIAAFVDDEVTNLVCGYHLTILRSKPSKTDGKFLFYCFNSQETKEQLAVGANGVTRYGLSQSAIKNLRLPAPDLPTQKAIATYLDERTARIDDLITAKHTLLDLLAERRAALITRAVTRGLDENVATRPSGVEWLGEIPVGWEVKRLRFLTSVVGGGTPTTSNIEYWKGDIPWVSPKDMKTGVIQKTQDFITDLGLASSPCALIAENTMIMVIRSGILRHSIPVALTGRPVTLNQDMKAFIPNRLVQSWFLYYVFHGLQKQLLPLLTKPGSTVESIEMQYLMDLEIPLPSVHLQNEIIQRLQKKLRQYETTQARIESSLHYLQEYRAALITAAVNGKLTSKFQ